MVLELIGLCEPILIHILFFPKLVDEKFTSLICLIICQEIDKKREFHQVGWLQGNIALYGKSEKEVLFVLANMEEDNLLVN
jgi:hypothetical protein